MNDIVNTINESIDIEKVNVVCVKDLETKHLKFKKGETFVASRVNKNWWCIDAVGITEKAFKTYFKKNPKVDNENS